MVIGACTSSPEVFSSPEVLPTSTATQPSSPPLSVALTPSPSPTLLSHCADEDGTTETLSLTTERLYFPLRFLVYLPPCYDPQGEQTYPTLYLFHGLFYDESQWVRIGVLDIASRLIANDEIPPFLIILPYDPSGKEPDQYAFAEAITEEMVPYVDTHYRTCAQASCRAVGGLSRGGGWAIHLAFTRPDLFSAAGAHSPALFWSDTPHYDDWLVKIPPENLPRLWLDSGMEDPLTPSIQQFEAFLNRSKVPHEWYLFQGGHEEAYWNAHVEQYLRWYAAPWVAAGSP